MYIYLNVYIYIYTHTLCICVHVHVHACARVNMCACVRACVRACVCVCTCACVQPPTNNQTRCHSNSQEHQWEESLNDGTLSRTSTIPKSSRSPPCTHPHQQTGTPPRSSHVPVLLTPTAIFYTTSTHTPPSSVQTDRHTDTHSNKPVHAQHTIAHTHTHTLSACRPQLISLLNSSLSPR